MLGDFVNRAPSIREIKTSLKTARVAASQVVRRDSGREGTLVAKAW